MAKDISHNADFCRELRKEMLNIAGAKIAAKFKRENIGITFSKFGCRKFYTVEVVNGQGKGKNWFHNHVACCANAAVADAIDEYIKQMPSIKEKVASGQDELLHCPRCARQSLHRIEICSEDSFERKSSYSCLECDNEDIVYIVTPTRGRKRSKDNSQREED